MVNFSFIRRGASFFIGGFTDRFASRITGKKKSFGKCIAAKFNECEPWTDHFEISSLEMINQALAEKDFASARGLAAFGVAEGASPYCVKIASLAIELLSEGEEVIFNLFTFGIE